MDIDEAARVTDQCLKKFLDEHKNTADPPSDFVLELKSVAPADTEGTLILTFGINVHLYMELAQQLMAVVNRGVHALHKEHPALIKYGFKIEVESSAPMPDVEPAGDS